MTERYKIMRQDNLLTNLKTMTAITPPPPQLTGNKAARGVLGVCTLLILSLVMGACGSSDDTDDATPTKGKSDNTTKDKEENKTVKYTVTFDLGGGTGTTPNPQTVAKDDKATKPDDPTKDGYTFNGWYEKQDGSGTVFAFTTIITSDKTLYARWTIKTYTVTFDLNYTGATDTPVPQTINKGKTAADPTIDDYDFEGWYTQQDGSGTAFAFDTTPITGDTILYAKWTCPNRKARKELTHLVPLYNEGKEDAPYLPKKLRGTFADGAGDFLYLITRPTGTAGQGDELPDISPYPSFYVQANQDAVGVNTGNFEITPDYIDASFTNSITPSDNTVRISCYSMKQVNDSLYFYYGKVRFLRDGQETEAFNKAMYAWTGIDKRDPANKDALYGYMVSIQDDYLRTLKIYPFVGGTYTRSASGNLPEKKVTFPKTEQDYADLTLEDLNIIATAPLTSDLLFAGFRPAGIYGIGN